MMVERSGETVSGVDDLKRCTRSSGCLRRTDVPNYSDRCSSSSSRSNTEVTRITTTRLRMAAAVMVALVVLLTAMGTQVEAGTLMGHPFSKRSFMDIQCKGVYDKSLFARLDRICEDCYNLFREPQLHTLCRLFICFLFIYA